MSAYFKTYSPIDGSIYVEREFSSSENIQQALLTAQLATKSWQKTSLDERKKYCTLAINALITNKEKIAEELCWQMGRPIRYAAGEIIGLEERAKYMINEAENALRPIHLPQKKGFIRYIKREPLGISFVIAPWNYPYLTAVNSIIPSIMAGNIVILKHSAQTPLVAERFAEAFRAADLPKGVFQYLHLTHPDTEKLIQTAPIHHIAFTGSVAGGHRVEKAAAGRFLSIGLELGGKDPGYVREDAHLDQAVAILIDGAFFNSGQSCCGIERIYIHHTIFDQFLKKAITLVNQYKLGRPDDPNTTLGPLARSTSADFIRKQINEAINQGAKAHINPKHFPLDHAGSAYMAPQILTQVNHSMRIMTEETFGPVIGIMPVANDDEAIQLMNDSEYGLTATVFTQNIDAGVRIGEELNTGTFFINRCDYLDPALAWTGVKHSGRGCSLSKLGYETLTRPKSFHLKEL